eukprot:1325928-Amorphochlora_amoeboformis.AAC.1
MQFPTSQIDDNVRHSPRIDRHDGRPDTLETQNTALKDQFFFELQSRFDLINPPPGDEFFLIRGSRVHMNAWSSIPFNPAHLEVDDEVTKGSISSVTCPYASQHPIPPPGFHRLPFYFKLGLKHERLMIYCALTVVAAFLPVASTRLQSLRSIHGLSLPVIQRFPNWGLDLRSSRGCENARVFPNAVKQIRTHAVEATTEIAAPPRRRPIDVVAVGLENVLIPTQGA